MLQKTMIMTMTKTKSKLRTWLYILVAIAIVVIGVISFLQYRKAHTFTLTGFEYEEIQPVLGLVRVSGSQDTDVWFVDVENPERRFQIGYITPGMSETIKLERGKWYRIEASGAITITMVNVRVE